MKQDKNTEIHNAILKLIEDKNYKVGQKLPSCRMLANSFGVNKLTIQKAYKKLEQNHIIYAVERGGYYLTGGRQITPISNPYTDFTRVVPENDMVPYDLFLNAMESAMIQYKNELFDMNDLQGLPSLRLTLSRLYEQEGLFITKDQIMITNGIQQGIHLIFQLLLKDRKKTLLMESPTYSLARELAVSMNIRIETIERHKTGYDMKALEKLFKREDIAVFYLIPRHHNPTGYSLDEVSKREVVKLANRYKVILIEDDFLAELAPKKRQMPLYYYNLKDEHFYLRSFSKTFIPGIRIGAMIVPKIYREPLKHLKHLNDLNTSKINQAALKVFIESGMYGKHIQNVRQKYTEKMSMAKAIFKDAKHPFWHIPDGGIFIWGEFDEALPIEDIIVQLKSEGILIKQDSNFKKQKKCIRISLIGVPIHDMDKLRRIKELFES